MNVKKFNLETYEFKENAEKFVDFKISEFTI